MDGLVTKYDHKKGFGFLKCLNGDNPPLPNVFFHISQVRGYDSVPLGARCRFVIVDGKEGKPQAAEVRPLELSGKARAERPLRRRAQAG